MSKLAEEDVIFATGNDGDYLWLSDKAERRLMWILTGAMVLAVSPVFILAILM